MKSCTIYLIEAGFPVDLPAVPRGLPSASFPFWGHYCFLDFAFANLQHLSENGVHLVTDSRFRGLSGMAMFRGELEKLRPRLLETGLPDFLTELEQAPSEVVLIYPLSLVCIADRQALAYLIEKPAADIIKLSVDNTPVDMYICRKKLLMKLIKTALAQKPAAVASLELLFTEILQGGFELIENIPGYALFQNNLMQLYEGNLWLAANAGTPQLVERLSHLAGSKSPDGEIIIEKGGTVKSSFLASGTVVAGYVEGSVLFPNVIVRRGAVVYNSIVMNNNHIGSKAQVQKCLILPRLGDNGKNAANIGEEAFIGLRQSSAFNEQFPSQIREGITVLGVNAEIPKGYTIGPGCLVGAEVPPQQLRKQKEMRKGSTILWSTRP